MAEKPVLKKWIIGEFIRNRLIFYIIGFSALITTSLLQTFMPKLLGYITDCLRNRTATVKEIYGLVLLLLTVSIIIFVVKYVWRYCIIGKARDLECFLRAKLFAHLQTLPMKFYNDRKTGDLMAYAINDLGAVRQAFAFGLVFLVDGVIINLVSLYVMVKTINPFLTILAMGPVIAAVIIILLMGKSIRARFLVVQNAFSDLSEKIQENISGIRVVKGFVQEREEISKLDKVSENRRKVQMEYVKLSALLGPSSQICFGISFALVLIVGGIYVSRKIISLGDFIAFNTYLTMLTGPVTNAGKIVEVWQRALASMKRLNDIFVVKPDISSNTDNTHNSVISSYTDNNINSDISSNTDNNINSDIFTNADNNINSDIFTNADNDSKLNISSITDNSSYQSCKESKMLNGEIEIRDLTFSYPGSSRKVLKNINLLLMSGKTLAIIGKTGSGKTTLANLLLRLYNVECGKIFIDKIDINDIPVSKLRENIGYVPQDNFLFSATIRQNISFFKEGYELEEIEEAAKAASVHDNISDFPEGFETVVGERGITLSGGQKQRISIARALLKEPSVLILDDSLSAVDTSTEEEILGNIKNILKGRTGIIIAHRISTVKHADIIIMLEKGRIIEQGTHDELLSLKGHYFKLYKAQMAETEISNEDNQEFCMEAGLKA